MKELILNSIDNPSITLAVIRINDGRITLALSDEDRDNSIVLTVSMVEQLQAFLASS